MFPAPAGMSPTERCNTMRITNVPRTRGDEPLVMQIFEMPKICSPHPRG